MPEITFKCNDCDKTVTENSVLCNNTKLCYFCEYKQKSKFNYNICEDCISRNLDNKICKQCGNYIKGCLFSKKNENVYHYPYKKKYYEKIANYDETIKNFSKNCICNNCSLKTIWNSNVKCDVIGCENIAINYHPKFKNKTVYACSNHLTHLIYPERCCYEDDCGFGNTECYYIACEDLYLCDGWKNSLIDNEEHRKSNPLFNYICYDEIDCCYPIICEDSYKKMNINGKIYCFSCTIFNGYKYTQKVIKDEQDAKKHLERQIKTKFNKNIFNKISKYIFS